MRSKTYTRGGYGGAAFSESGGDLAAKLLLLGNPTLSMEAATKNYVELKHANLSASLFGIGAVPIAALPAFVGDVRRQEGSNTTALNSLGLSPGNYAKVTVDAKGRVNAVSFLAESDIPVLSWSKINAGLPTTVAGYGITDALTATGDTMTGTLSVAAASNTLSSLANKAHVDGKRGVVKPGEVIRRCSSITPVGYLRTNAGLVSKTTYSRLYKIVMSNEVVPVTAGAGQPWCQQYEFNTTGTALGTWSTTTGLPITLRFASVAVTENRVYLLGGENGTGILSSVYTAPINPDGTLGTWTAATNLPVALRQAQAVVAKNTLYLIGGWNGTVHAATVYKAPINSDGTLGNWSLDTPLPQGNSQFSGFIARGRLHVAGGYFDNAIYSAIINPDGSLGNWTAEEALPGTVRRGAFAVTRNRVYSLGGNKGGSPISNVYTAAITDGHLGPWALVANLPVTTRSLHGRHPRCVYHGWDIRQLHRRHLQCADQADGTLGTWTADASWPLSLSASSHVTSSASASWAGEQQLGLPVDGSGGDLRRRSE